MSHSSNVNKFSKELHEEITADLNDSHKKGMPKTKKKVQTSQVQERTSVNVMFRHVSNEGEKAFTCSGGIDETLSLP